MKTKLLFALMNLFLLASCGKKDEPIPKPDPIPPPPIAEGETHWMTLSGTKAAGDTIKFFVNAAEADRTGVWIDLNANGKKEEGEAVTEFNKSAAYSLGAKTIVVYGKVIAFECQESSLTALDVSSNAALELLYCHGNQLGLIDVSKIPAFLYLWCNYNALTDLDISKTRKLKELWLSGNKRTDTGKMQKIVDALHNLKGNFWMAKTKTSKKEPSVRHW